MKWSFNILVAWLILQSSQLWAQEKVSKGYILEAAPLQGALGQLATRAESKWEKSFNWAITYEHWSQQGEVPLIRDVSDRLAFELLSYPETLGLKGVYLFGGISFEHATISRRKERDYLSNIKYTEDERYDLWVNQDDYVAVPLGIGYRWTFGEVVTASLRFIHDSHVYTHSRNETQEIYSLNANLATKGRPAHQQRLAFYAGITFD